MNWDGDYLFEPIFVDATAPSTQSLPSHAILFSPQRRLKDNTLYSQVSQRALQSTAGDSLLQSLPPSTDQAFDFFSSYPILHAWPCYWWPPSTVHAQFTIPCYECTADGASTRQPAPAPHLTHSLRFPRLSRDLTVRCYQRSSCSSRLRLCSRASSCRPLKHARGSIPPSPHPFPRREKSMSLRKLTSVLQD